MRSRRLLVTFISEDKLLLYGPDGAELKCITFSSPESTIRGVRHALETSHGTFVVAHTKPRRQVIEVDDIGRVIHVYSDQQQLGDPWYMTFDSDCRVFVADMRMGESCCWIVAWSWYRSCWTNQSCILMASVTWSNQANYLLRTPVHEIFKLTFYARSSWKCQCNPSKL